MRAALVIAIASWLAACDEVDCPGIGWIDRFSLILDDEGWQPAHYSIEVSYSDRLGSYAFRCDVPVPGYAWDGVIDGGMAYPDAGSSAATGELPCVPLMPTGRLASARLGKAIVLDFEGTPALAHIIISRDGELLVEQDIMLDYTRKYPHGRACAGPEEATLAFELPD